MINEQFERAKTIMACTLALQDKMTPALLTINKATENTLKAMRNIENKGGEPDFDSKKRQGRTK